MAASVSRRDFARLFAIGGSAALFADPVWAKQNAKTPAFAPTISGSGEAFWKSVRDQFVMPPDLGVLNAANLCPSSRPVLEALKRETEFVDRDPSGQNRARLTGEKENLRKTLAAFLRVTPEEIVITRNTSEANNLVSSGLDLKAGDEVVVFHDNHPSNLTAWHEKSKRFGFKVIEIPQVNPHPGMEYYVDAYKKAITANTKIITFTHLTSTVGDLFPAKELCALARERGVMSLVDGAQTFGLLDVNLADISPDFYSGSAHKWPCGARESGVLYINARVHQHINKSFWPLIYSAYPGAVGASRNFESYGQRDEATMIAFREALEFQMKVGREAIEKRSRQLANQLIAGLSKLPEVKVWTSPNPSLNAAVVSFLPGSLNSQKLGQVLYEKDKIGTAGRGGQDRGGLRASPHFYNTPEEVDRLVSAVGRYLKSGV
jgi:selenocysteine lyase/cysteine desulfurase